MKKTIRLLIMWLCGLWALGLGSRYTLELLLTDSWISIPKYAGYGVNIWFDFLPLAVFGFVVVIFTTKELIQLIRKKR